jgi:hypothetical protein
MEQNLCLVAKSHISAITVPYVPLQHQVDLTCFTVTVPTYLRPNNTLCLVRLPTYFLPPASWNIFRTSPLHLNITHNPGPCHTLPWSCTTVTCTWSPKITKPSVMVSSNCNNHLQSVRNPFQVHGRLKFPAAPCTANMGGEG